MRRTSVVLTDEQYELVRKLAYDQSVSISSVVRRLIDMRPRIIEPPEKKPQTTTEMKFPNQEARDKAIKEIKPIHDSYFNPQPKKGKK